MVTKDVIRFPVPDISGEIVALVVEIGCSVLFCDSDDELNHVVSSVDSVDVLVTLELSWTVALLVNPFNSSKGVQDPIVTQVAGGFTLVKGRV